MNEWTDRYKDKQIDIEESIEGIGKKYIYITEWSEWNEWCEEIFTPLNERRNEERNRYRDGKEWIRRDESTTECRWKKWMKWMNALMNEVLPEWRQREK